MMMLHLIPPALMMCLGEVIGQPGDYGLTERAYVYLGKQDLGTTVLGRSIDGVRRPPPRLHAVCVFVPTVMLTSVFSVLLVLMIFMAVCVYKPLTRRWNRRKRRRRRRGRSLTPAPSPVELSPDTGAAPPAWLARLRGELLQAQTA